MYVTVSSALKVVSIAFFHGQIPSRSCHIRRPLQDTVILGRPLRLSFPLSPPPPHVAFSPGQLTSLLASPAHVAYLLAMRSTKGGSHIVPNLVSISIKPFEDFGYSSIDCALHMLSQSSLKDISLTVWLYFWPRFGRWLKKFSEAEDDDITHDYWALLHCVRRLHIQSLYSNPIGRGELTLIPRWLSKLPSVEQVTFGTPCFAWMGYDERKMLEAEIMSMCPQLNEISVYSRM